MGRARSLTVACANIAEANVDVTVLDEDDDETEDNDNAHRWGTWYSNGTTTTIIISTSVRFLKAISTHYDNVDNKLNGHVY